MGLISSLFNVASSRDMKNNCSSSHARIMVLPKLTLTPLHGFMEDLVTAVNAEVLILLYSCLKCSVKCQTTLKTKHNHPFTLTCQLWGHAITSELPDFHSSKRRYFSCSSLSTTLCNRAGISEYEAYWHMNLSLISGCSTCKKKFIHGHSFF